MTRLIFLLFLTFSSLQADAPKAVIFDFGGVVAHVHREPLLNFLTQTFGSSVRRDFKGDRLYAALNQGNSFFQTYAEKMGKTLSSDWWETFEQKKALLVELTPGVQEQIDLLKKAGMQIALLSNTSKERSRYFKSQGYYAPFSPLILSCDVGMKKPNPRIYQLLLNTLQLPPSSCVFIDNKTVNVKAAERLGIRSIHFHSSHQLQGI